jgi:UDP-N-acetylglucosamine/UDP-N-acetylgalactosamine diphosphorylase
VQPVDDPYARLRRKLAPYGQEHVLRFWDRLDGTSRSRLARQVESFDLELIDELVKTRVLSAAPVPALDFGPIEVTRLPRTVSEHAAFKRARRVGEDLLRQGRVACVVVAGGQGTRLGVDVPKGTFPIGPVSRKSIFELHIERIRALARRFETCIPLLVMTSPVNDSATREFFRSNNNFLLPEEDLVFFVQGVMPAVDFAGRLILDAADHVFVNPNGHGGVMPALVESGAIAEMRRRGITDIFHCQVDNVLVKMAEPVFLGFHRETRAQMSSKVCRKRDAAEKVGVTVKRADGRTAVVEYTCLTGEQTRRMEGDGSLSLWAANLCIYWYTVDFAETVGRDVRLPFNLARKKIPCIDRDARRVEPTEPNGIKFETFVFDAFPHAEKTFLMEVDRAEEFAPVKNMTGEDSVDSAQLAMTERYARWLESGGVSVPRGVDGRPRHPIEISPFCALDAEELKRKLPDRLVIDGPLLLDQ